VIPPPRRRPSRSALAVCDLRTARKRAGFTQEELAAKAQVRQALISKLESGVIKNPRFATVLRIARALQINPAELMFDGDSSAAIP
jgi:predicted transcriptional regulator